MDSKLVLIISVVCILLLIRAIFTSSRRLASLGYAILACGLVFALGMVSAFFLVPPSAPIAETYTETDAALKSLSHSRAIIASVAETNAVLDRISAAVTIGGLVAAVWGAYKPPRRVKT